MFHFAVCHSCCRSMMSVIENTSRWIETRTLKEHAVKKIIQGKANRELDSCWRPKFRLVDVNFTVVLCNFPQKSLAKLSHVSCKHGHHNSSFCSTSCPKIQELNVPGEEVLPWHKGTELVAKSPHLKQLGQLPVITTAASCKVKWTRLNSNWWLDVWLGLWATNMQTLW